MTKADFEKIADAGFNIVRIPIGCMHLCQLHKRRTDISSDWAYQKANDPYVEGAAPYIDKAIKWARQTNLKVLIDLHGAPGSQNGYDNSGHNGTVDWLTEDDSLENTKAVIQIIANKYARKSYQDVVVGIQLLNEPLASEIEGGADAVVNYYSDAYDNVRIISDTPVVVHDAFQRSSFWDKKLNPPEYQGVIVDHHEYQIFTDKLINLSAEVVNGCSDCACLANLGLGTCGANLLKHGPVLFHNPLGRGWRMERCHDGLCRSSKRVWPWLSLGR